MEWHYLFVCRFFQFSFFRFWTLFCIAIRRNTIFCPNISIQLFAKAIKKRQIVSFKYEYITTNEKKNQTFSCFSNFRFFDFGTLFWVTVSGGIFSEITKPAFGYLKIKPKSFVFITTILNIFSYEWIIKYYLANELRLMPYRYPVFYIKTGQRLKYFSLN